MHMALICGVRKGALGGHPKAELVFCGNTPLVSVLDDLFTSFMEMWTAKL
jgi:hypothetical protein